MPTTPDTPRSYDLDRILDRLDTLERRVFGPASEVFTPQKPKPVDKTG